MADQDLAGYYLQISGGEISGGAGVPADCLALEGFHAIIPWACYAVSFFTDCLWL